jgi:pimeloyl-ACP methyl ester carboxylesterase
LRRIILETYRVGEIPITTMADESAEHRPVVFYLHGFTLDRRDGLSLGYRLAECGFYFVAVDAPMHGERRDERLDAILAGEADLVYPVGTGLDVFFLVHELILQLAQDIEILIGHLRGDSRADISRIGVTGASMGGMATFYLAAHNPLIQVAVPMIGIPAFAERWADAVLEASAYEKWAAAMEAVGEETLQRAKFMVSIDPFDKMKTFYPKPLLMICGDQDLAAPKKYSVDLYRMLRPLYVTHPERLRLNIYDDAAHRVTTSMMDDACDWFCRYL